MRKTYKTRVAPVMADAWYGLKRTDCMGGKKRKGGGQDEDSPDSFAGMDGALGPIKKKGKNHFEYMDRPVDSTQKHKS